MLKTQICVTRQQFVNNILYIFGLNCNDLITMQVMVNVTYSYLSNKKDLSIFFSPTRTYSVSFLSTSLLASCNDKQVSLSINTHKRYFHQYSWVNYRRNRFIRVLCPTFGKQNISAHEHKVQATSTPIPLTKNKTC